MQERFDAGEIVDARDRPQQGWPHRRPRRPWLRADQPDRRLPRRPRDEQPRDAAQEIAEKLQPFVGRTLRLKILEVNRKANRLILSEKVALYEERREKRDELFSSLETGQRVWRRRALDRAVRCLRRPRAGSTASSTRASSAGTRSTTRDRAPDRRRGRGRGHRHQPRARPHQPLDPPPPARSVAGVRGEVQDRRRDRWHGHRSS